MFVQFFVITSTNPLHSTWSINSSAQWRDTAQFLSVDWLCQKKKKNILSQSRALVPSSSRSGGRVAKKRNLHTIFKPWLTFWCALKWPAQKVNWRVCLFSNPHPIDQITIKLSYLTFVSPPYFPTPYIHLAFTNCFTFVYNTRPSQLQAITIQVSIYLQNSTFKSFIQILQLLNIQVNLF